MSDERKVQKDTPGRYTTNTEPAKGPDYNREAYYGGRADQTIPQPHAGDGTQGQDISEHSAIRSVVGRLRQHPGIDTSRIDVGYDDGTVTLTGGVFAEDVRQQAEEIAAGVPGVKAVHNNIRILPHGLGNQPPHGCGNVGGGMEVYGSDGGHIGRVKELQVARFLVVRDGAPDVFVPFDNCERVEDNGVHLKVASGQVDAMGWEHPEPFTPVP